MTYVTYHLRLEMSFLMDEFAMPPRGPDESTLDMALSPGSSTSASPTSSTDALFHKQVKMADGIEIGFSDMEDVSMFCRSKEREGQCSKGKDKEEQSAAELGHKDGRGQSRMEKMQRQEGEENLQCDGQRSGLSSRSQEGKDNLKPAGQVQGRRSWFSSHETVLDSHTKESSVVEIEDFSDPLHSYQISKDEGIFQSEVTLEEDNSTRKRFKAALDDVLLNASPYVRYDLPYLQTETGSKCKLRTYFGPELYWSPRFCEGTEKRKGRTSEANEGQGQQKQLKVKVVAPHPFVMEKLTKSTKDPDTQVYIIYRYTYQVPFVRLFLLCCWDHFYGKHNLNRTLALP